MLAEPLASWRGKKLLPASKSVSALSTWVCKIVASSSNSYTDSTAPVACLWVAWVRQHANIASFEGELVEHHWIALRGLLPMYRAITTM